MTEFFIYLEDITVSPGYLNEVNRDKTKVPNSVFFFEMFRLSVLLLNSMS